MWLEGRAAAGITRPQRPVFAVCCVALRGPDSRCWRRTDLRTDLKCVDRKNKAARSAHVTDMAIIFLRSPDRDECHWSNHGCLPKVLVDGFVRRLLTTDGRVDAPRYVAVPGRPASHRLSMRMLVLIDAVRRLSKTSGVLL